MAKLNFEDAYKKYFGYEKPEVMNAVRDANDIDSVKHIVSMARERKTFQDKCAFSFMFRICFAMSAKHFWKFLGPDPKARKFRISNGDHEVFFGLAAQAMVDALKAFDENKYTDIEALVKGLQFYYRGYIKAECERYNRDYDDEQHMIHPDQEEPGKEAPGAESGRRGWNNEGYQGDGPVSDPEAEFIKSQEEQYSDDDPKSIWIKICQDPEMHSGKQPWNKMLAEVLLGHSVEEISKTYGVSKNSIRDHLFNCNMAHARGSQGLLADMLKKYHMSQDDFAMLWKNNLQFVTGELIK